MLVTIKPHSVLAQHFVGDDIKINIDSYSDLLDYLIVMQPAFIYYSKQVISEGLQESFVFLDENLQEVERDDFFIKKFKKDTTVYIVPIIMGGGGKRGGVLAILAAAALFFAAGPIGGALASGLSGTGLTTAAATLGVQQLAFGLAINGLSAILMKAPSLPKNSDSTRVENNMFSSLRNTIDSGTFVPVNYGMPRVAGQLITGYIKTINHSKGFKVSVSDVIGFNSALYDSDIAAQSGFLTIPTNISVVVRDGLIMYIDPGNTGSYPGSGTSITDLISGQVGTISGDISLDNFAFKLEGGTINMGKSYISSSEISNTNYSIDFWAKVPSTITSGIIISNDVLGVSLAKGSATKEYTNRGKAGGTRTKTVTYSDYTSINTVDAINNRTILDSWVHIAYTVANTTLKTYTNGELRATEDITTDLNSPVDLTIGSSGLAGTYLGLIRLFNKALTQEQIAKNFNAEKARFEISSNSSFILPSRKLSNDQRPGK